MSHTYAFPTSFSQTPFVVNLRTPIDQTLLSHLACPVAETVISPTEASLELRAGEVSVEARAVPLAGASPPHDTRLAVLVEDPTTFLRDTRSEGPPGAWLQLNGLPGLQEVDRGTPLRPSLRMAQDEEIDPP